ncbi:hypothetical protein EBR66_08045 [bacterium]|nr:hypothetical protein [bacterium]
MKIPHDKHLLIHQTIAEIDWHINYMIEQNYRLGKHNEEIRALEKVRRLLNRDREELTDVTYRNYLRTKKGLRMGYRL